MLALAGMLILFWFVPEEYDLLSLFCLSLAGFFVYGPQVLIGVASADLSSKKAIGTANGLVSVFANIGSALAGVCVGWLIDNAGWSWVFVFFVTSAIIGAGFFGLTWIQGSSKKEG
jgi:OPA family glycerol-3-phosphate transporter-like MFS transporter